MSDGAVDDSLLDRAVQLGRSESGLAVVVSLRADGSVQASVVNAGLLRDPLTGERVVAFVARGGTKKLANLRVRPRTTVVFRPGWEWVAVEGEAELVGPDDRVRGLASDGVASICRAVYAAAVGGVADDWAHLDSVMAAERHTAVLVRPTRAYSNPALP